MSEKLSILEQDNVAPTSATSSLGELGERLALNHLINHGYRIVMTNFKVPVGRNTKGVAVTGEIDIVALDGDTVCFVEVKTRRSEEFTPVITAVDRRKQRQITRTSRAYRRVFNIMDVPVRFDVITVLVPKHAEPEIKLIKSVWTENAFVKKRWSYESWNEFA